MNTTIVKFALREVILTENLNLSDFTRKEALDELIRMERAEVEAQSTAEITGEQMRSFREHRKTHDRIPTIKMVRSVLNCGLAEALIIVKGIESHDGIV